MSSELVIGRYARLKWAAKLIVPIRKGSIFCRECIVSVHPGIKTVQLPHTVALKMLGGNDLEAGMDLVDRIQIGKAPMLTNTIRLAWRIIARNRLYSIINVASLALGICGCIVIWLVASYEFSFDKFHPDAARIYRVGNGGPKAERKEASVIPPMPDVIRRTIPGVQRVATVFPLDQGARVTIPAGGSKLPVHFDTKVAGQTWVTSVIITDSNWFDIFHYQWLAGSPGSSMEQPFSVVLTEERARQYFGSLSPDEMLGKEVVYQDSLHVRVAGIVKGWTAHTDLPYSDFITLGTIPISFLHDTRHMDDWVWHEGAGKWFWPECFVKLNAGVSPQNIAALLRPVGQQVIGSDSAHPFLMQLQPLSDIHFNTAYVGDGVRKAHLPTLYALMAIAVFVLLLGTVNFINLSTAQLLQRAKEIGVRKVLGSGKTALAVQFLTETGVITFFAVLLATLLVDPVLSCFREYIPEGVSFHPLALPNLLFLTLIGIGTSLLAGFYPAKVIAGYLPVVSLKGGGSQKGGEKWWLRKSLIVFQFSISLVFIIVALLMGNQIRYMLKTDYGFKADAIVSVLVKQDFWDTTSRIDVVQQRFKQLPGAAEVVKQGSPPLGWGGWTMAVEYKGKQDIVQPAMMDFGDDKFIPFYGMRLVAGRNLRHSDSLREWVINETSARGFGFSRPADAVGQLLYFGKKAYPIVGIVADFHQGSFKESIQPVVIGHLPRWEGSLGIRLASTGKSPEEVKDLLKAMERIYKAVYPNDPFSYVFLDDSIAQLYKTEQQTAALVRAVMVLAIFISCMGLFGLALFTARRRAAEISIRKVLGATTGNIAMLLNKGFAILVLLSLVIASPVAWWMTDRWLRDFAYRTSIAWWVFPLAGTGAVLIALLTVSLQSIRAAMSNPIKNLRTE